MRLPRLFHNRLSYLGAGLAALGLLLFVFLFVVHTLTGAGRVPYAGLVIFILVPLVLLFGLLLIPIGMAFEWRRWRRAGVRAVPRFPVIDLNQSAHRNATFVFGLGSIFLLFLSAFGSYQAYHYTDSVTFCGLLCHQVMKPEYTAYQNSPHARVTCVECHVGPGADWFVRSKLSGTYQVYAVLFDKYPRPIPTPIESLRPAQETCEQCHWPEQFFGGQQKWLTHYLPDEQNTRWEINLLVKTGGGNPRTGQAEGIHWHMNIANRVEYIATDAKRQTIPWVRMTNLKTGEVREFVSTDRPPSPAAVPPGTVRRMDCMDCHNRPTHIFRSPSDAVNRALATGRIDPSLPYLKRTGVELLAAPYRTTGEAVRAIDEGVRRFYGEKYPALAREKAAAVDGAVAALQEIYQRSFFPEMKTRWDIYPDDVGHLLFPGCARCHDGLHRTADGKTITDECNACHTILAQGRQRGLAFAGGPQGLGFEHPEDIGDAWRAGRCSDCHSGRAP